MERNNLTIFHLPIPEQRWHSNIGSLRNGWSLPRYHSRLDCHPTNDNNNDGTDSVKKKLQRVLLIHPHQKPKLLGSYARTKPCTKCTNPLQTPLPYSEGPHTPLRDSLFLLSKKANHVDGIKALVEPPHQIHSLHAKIQKRFPLYGKLSVVQRTTENRH